MGDTTTAVHIRWMIPRDMPEVVEIENAGFSDPYTGEELRRELLNRKCIPYVAEREERVLGFMIYELRRASLRVFDFAVHPDFRRRGVGRQMAEKLVGKLSPYRRSVVSVSVVEDNLPAHLFWRAQGFLAVGVQQQPFKTSDLDAYLFEYDVTRATVGAGR